MPAFYLSIPPLSHLSELASIVVADAAVLLLVLPELSSSTVTGSIWGSGRSPVSEMDSVSTLAGAVVAGCSAAGFIRILRSREKVLLFAHLPVQRVYRTCALQMAQKAPFRAKDATG